MSSRNEDDAVVLVDAQDREVGTSGKLAAHENGGRLHRAFSVLVFDSNGQTLVQRRSEGKYHAGGQWTNTCCSHPRPGEDVMAAAHRRLREEFGFDCPLREAFSFVYEAPVGRGLTEREFDHVLIGLFEGEPRPDPDEISDFRWMKLEDLFSTVRLDSTDFTPWFKMILIHLAEPSRRHAVSALLGAA